MVVMGCLDPPCDLLEIGPGYGRILDSILDSGQGFDTYIGVDISLSNIAFLEDKYRLRGVGNVAFKHDDIYQFEAMDSYSTIFASLVFKHFYPDFSAAAKRCWDSLQLSGQLVFDFPNDIQSTNWESDHCFVRRYSNDEVASILSDIGFVNLRFGTVCHGNKVRGIVKASKQ